MRLALFLSFLTAAPFSALADSRYTLTDITPSGIYKDARVVGISNAGQVVFNLSGGDWTSYLYDHGAISPLTETSSRQPGSKDSFCRRGM